MNDNKCISLGFLKKILGNAETYSASDIENAFGKGLEIVRCSDCKHSLWESDKLRACQKFCQYMPSTGYCFRAERRTESNEESKA